MHKDTGQHLGRPEKDPAEGVRQFMDMLKEHGTSPMETRRDGTLILAMAITSFRHANTRKKLDAMLAGIWERREQGDGPPKELTKPEVYLGIVLHNTLISFGVEAGFAGALVSDIVKGAVRLFDPERAEQMGASEWDCNDCEQEDDDG